VKQIENAERWLNRHSRDAVLLLTLGKLCGRQKLWGKAQSYLEASLSVEASSDGHHALAQLLERLDKPEDAARHYKRSLELARSMTH
jgi:HemY protein